MRGYAARNIFGRTWIDTWEVATEIVEKIHDPDCEVRCHELARAVQRALQEGVGDFVTIVDGKYGAVEHSWLKLDKDTILDVYVPGRLPMVQLIHYSGLLPMWENYKERQPRTDIDEVRVKELFKEMTAGYTFPL